MVSIYGCSLHNSFKYSVYLNIFIKMLRKTSTFFKLNISCLTVLSLAV